MDRSKCESKIVNSFRKQVQGDSSLRSAFLLVQSEMLGVDLNIAETGSGSEVHADQPNHLASVGKLFTATLIAMLYEQGKLDFEDPIGTYLDVESMDGLHVYRGREYSGEITLRQLLMQTSGLYDVFYPLLEKMMEDPSFSITTREAVAWGRQHMKPAAEPGKKHHYTDTNYYLLGFIVEAVTGKPFHRVMHEYIFDPLGMTHAYMHGYSTPKEESGYPCAGLYIKETDFCSVKGAHELDFAGGSVVAPLSEYLLFMKALTGHRIIREETLERMIEDDVHMGFPTLGFDYGYSIWKTRPVPLLMPAETYCWGCVGVTGAFMFHHPGTEAYVIGTFNDFAYRGKALSFMMKSVIRELLSSAEASG